MSSLSMQKECGVGAHNKKCGVGVLASSIIGAPKRSMCPIRWLILKGHLRMVTSVPSGVDLRPNTKNIGLKEVGLRAQILNIIEETYMTI